MKLWIMTRCALVAVLALAWSCSDEETGPIGVAVVGPLTGDASHVGEQIRNVTEMVLEESGGEVRGRQIIPVYVDSQSDPDLAAEAYREVIQDPENNIVSGFFNWHSDVSVSLMDVAADEDMAHVCALGATGEINDKVEADPERYEGWSKGWPTPSKLAQNYITAISDAIEAGTFSPSELNAAVYGEDTSWGRSFGEAIRVGLEDAGWTIVAEIYLPQDAIDFTDAVQTISDESPTLIAGTFASSSMYSFLQQIQGAYEEGEEQPLIVADGLGWNSDWYESLGDDSNYIVDQIPQFATDEAQDFSQRYQDRYGTAPSPSAGGLCYDYAHVLLEVLRAADDSGEISRESVMQVHAEQLRGGTLTYSDGILMAEYRWDPESGPDPVVGPDAFTFPVLQYIDGNVNVVWPEALGGDTNISGPPTAE